MKFIITSLLTLSTLTSVAEGFTITPTSSTQRRFGLAIRAENKPFFAEEMPKTEETIYDKLGFAEDKIAIGIEPEDVLEYLGTRDNLIARFESDNPKFDMERAAAEVDRFMLDGEMVSKYIGFEKKKREPSNLREEAEQNLSDPSTWATYAIWIIGGAGFALVKNKVIEPKYASGEWEDIHIQLPNIFPVNEGAGAAAEKAAEIVSQTPDVAAVVEAVVN